MLPTHRCMFSDNTHKGISIAHFGIVTYLFKITAQSGLRVP